MRKKKRILSFLLAFAMMFGCLPNASFVFAEETEPIPVETNNGVRIIELDVGETSEELPGRIDEGYESSENIEVVETVKEYTLVEGDGAIQEGQYLIGQEKNCLTNGTVGWADRANGLGMETIDNFDKPLTDEQEGKFLWTVTKKSDSEYIIYDKQENYITYAETANNRGEYNVSVNTQNENARQVFNIISLSSNMYAIKNGDTYLNNLGDSGCAGGYNADASNLGAGNKWSFYQPQYFVTVKGIAEGETSITVGGILYQINVRKDTVNSDILAQLQNKIQEYSNSLEDLSYTCASREVLRSALDLAGKIMANSSEYSNAEAVNALELLNVAYDALLLKEASLVPFKNENDEYIVTATAGSAHNDDQSAVKAIDDNETSCWHTNWWGSSYDDTWIQIELDKDYIIYGLNYMPPQGTGEGANGRIKEYRVFASTDTLVTLENERNKLNISEDNLIVDSEWTWEEITWNDTESDWGNVSFAPIRARYVCLKADSAMSNNNYKFAAAHEITLIGVPAADYSKINTLLRTLDDETLYTEDSWNAFKQVLDNIDFNKDEDGQEYVDEQFTNLQSAYDNLKYRSADYTTLDNKIAEAEELKKVVYTSESWTTLQDALTAANGVSRGLNITQQETVDAAVAALSAAMESLEEELKFSGAYLSLHDDISVHYIFDKEAFEDAGYSEFKLKFTLNGKTTTVEEPEWESVSTEYQECGTHEYVFENIAPQYMNDVITVVITATKDEKQVTSDEITYSVVRYCQNKFGDGEATDELKVLLANLLNYGSEAQKYVGHKVDELAINTLNDDQKALVGSVIDKNTLTSVTGFMGGAQDVQWKSATLRLDNSIMIRYKIEAADIEGLRVQAVVGNETKTIPSEEFTKVANETNQYYVYFDGLNAAQMSEAVETTVYNSEGIAVSNTLTYSIESYVKAKYESDRVGDIVKAIIKYGKAAEAYNSPN